MYINWKQREIIVTLALYGPQGSGKTTTWRYWADTASTSPQAGEDSFSLRMENIQGKQLVLNVRDVPGDDSTASSRRIALYGVDGLIFVADSDPARQEANRQSLQELQANLAAMQKAMHALPVLFQYNKRDLTGAVTLEELQNLLNPQYIWPCRETTATQAVGLADVLKEATDLILVSVLQS
jgi:hypothetical protein